MAKIRVLGGSDWLPTENNDGASYIIGEHVMIDTGWSAPTRLLMAGESLQKYNELIFTHMHEDHVMGLPQLLLDWRIKCDKDLSGLNIFGPCEELRAVYDLAVGYGLRTAEGIIPATLRELKPVDIFETDEYIVKVMPSLHACPGRCYRLTEKTTGHSVGLSGDTAWQESYAAFFKNVDLLVYEDSYGTNRCDPATNYGRHSGLQEAARVANESGAKALMLTHSRCNREEALEIIRELVNVPVCWAQTGVEIEF